MNALKTVLKNADYFSQITLLVCIRHQSQASQKHVISVFRVNEAAGLSSEFGKLYEIMTPQTKMELKTKGRINVMNLPCLVVRQCPLIFPETPRKLTRTLAG
jgi:hypothetical protein